jgi:hypothetical protein
MFNSRFVRRVKIVMITSLAITGGAMFQACGMNQIKDALVAGALAGVQASTSGWVSSLIPDLNPVFDPLLDQPVVQTP